MFIMQKILYSLLAAVLLIVSVTVSAKDQPVTFDAVYKLFSSGFELAEMKRSIKQLPSGEYLYRSDTKTIGIVSVFYKDRIIEESKWHIEEGQLYPLHYTYTRKKSDRNRHVNIEFDWDKKIILNRVNDNLWKMPLEKGMLDKLLYQYAIMRDLPVKRFPITYSIADGGKMKSYHMERLGNEKVDTPLGKLHTVKLQNIKPGDDRKLIIWCAPKFKYLPVKVEHTEDNGRVTTAIIQKLEGI